MSEDNKMNKDVAVLGAGPAGIYAARELARAGYDVALINRDIKPGGLAEYGIYKSKHKMKEGLRKQFRQVMAEENLHYFGNLTIGEEQELSINDLKEMGFEAILITVGAQGTKWLGMPGEELNGVYHAKDLVYHYNQLPPFSEQKFDIGKKVLCIGVGNVMLDIAHWCIRDLKIEEVIAIARRGPADVKFTKKEMSIVGKNLDLEALDAEFARSDELMKAMNQDPDAAKNFILSALPKAEEKVSDTRFVLEFLASPKALLGDENGHVRAVEVNETTLELRDNGSTKAVNTGESREIEADTVVFCIGDKVDASLGLPLNQWNEFAKHPKPSYPIDENSYEDYNPDKDAAVEGIFLAGWSREASSGLVGSARKDGTNGANAMVAYLEAEGKGKDGAIAKLEAKVSGRQDPVVHKVDIAKLEENEAKVAEENGLDEFKSGSNDDMHKAMGLTS